jgi:hypothetical protein
MKIHLVGAELFDANAQSDGRTGMPKLIVTFHNFANVLEKRRRFSMLFRGALP